MKNEGRKFIYTVNNIDWGGEMYTGIHQNIYVKKKKSHILVKEAEVIGSCHNVRVSDATKIIQVDLTKLNNCQKNKIEIPYDVKMC